MLFQSAESTSEDNYARKALPNRTSRRFNEEKYSKWFHSRALGSLHDGNKVLSQDEDLIELLSQV